MRKFAVEHEEENQQRVDDREVLQEGSRTHEYQSSELDNGEVPEQYFSNSAFHRLVKEHIGNF